MKKIQYFVKGMHCSSCELLIENKLTKIKNVKKVNASCNKNAIEISYNKNPLSLKKLNKIFRQDGYTFYNRNFHKSTEEKLVSFNKNGIAINKKQVYSFATSLFVILAVILTFVVLNKSGFTALLSVNNKSSLAAFFVFGMLAGFSTCSALLGGIILSMTKKWSYISSKKNNLITANPNIYFNLGRIISFTILGLLLGLVGQQIKISPNLTSFITITISLVMLILGLQMLDIKLFKKIKIAMPKSLAKHTVLENNFQGQKMPFLMGFFSFLLPCGFTITTQGLALLSGNPLQAALIMLFFVLGTTPALYLIGQTSLKISRKPHLSRQFLKTAGILVLFFAVYNINAQLNVLGLKSLNDIFGKPKIIAAENGFAPIENGKQILKMDALSYGYEPSLFKVKTGTPVRWEITDQGTSGCTNAVISKGLFEGQIDLTPGTTSIQEFTPQKPGIYKFSCWMGMVSGTIEVVADNGQAVNSQVIDSGSGGCGGSCGGTCGGGCGNPSCLYK